MTLVYEHELPKVPGKSIKGVLVEYGPGGYSPAHTHGNAFIYATVLEGAIRSQINDGPVTIYDTGQSWSELPGDRHSVSANASETKPAKILAVFVVDTNEKELTTPSKPAPVTEAEVRRVIATLDGQGRWRSTYAGEALVGQPKFAAGFVYLSSGVFSRNLNLLSEILRTNPR